MEPLEEPLIMYLEMKIEHVPGNDLQKSQGMGALLSFAFSSCPAPIWSCKYLFFILSPMEEFKLVWFSAWDQKVRRSVVPNS